MIRAYPRRFCSSTLFRPHLSLRAALRKVRPPRATARAPGGPTIACSTSSPAPCSSNSRRKPPTTWRARALAVWQRALQQRPRPAAARDPLLAQELWGLSFPNPLGLAAGFDKNGALPHVWPALGFGFAELGTVTALAQPGNPAPRLFRLPAEHALINRLGFNNDGADAVARALAARLAAGRPPVPLGINLGKSKAAPLERAADDYCASLRGAARPRRLSRPQRQLAEHARSARPAGRGAARAAARRRAGRESPPRRRRRRRRATVAVEGRARPRRRRPARRDRGGARARRRRRDRHQHHHRPQRAAERPPPGARGRRPQRGAAARPGDGGGARAASLERRRPADHRRRRHRQRRRRLREDSRRRLAGAGLHRLHLSRPDASRATSSPSCAPCWCATASADVASTQSARC